MYRTVIFTLPSCRRTDNETKYSDWHDTWTFSLRCTKHEDKTLCNITILAALSFVALGAHAWVVADADSCVFARRVALRLGVENEPERDSARRVRTGGGKSDQGGKKETRWAETRKAHGWSAERESGRTGRTRTDTDGRCGGGNLFKEPRPPHVAPTAAHRETTTVAGRCRGECPGVGAGGL